MIQLSNVSYVTTQNMSMFKFPWIGVVSILIGLCLAYEGKCSFYLQTSKIQGFKGFRTIKNR